jgi:hypothetical protein
VKNRTSPFKLVTVTVCATLFAACGGGSQPNASLGMPPAASLAHQRSWMSPLAKSQALLYVSDAENDVVDVYKNFASNSVTRVGQLGGVQYPSGECTDRAGNVWVTELYGQDVVEFAHGGTSPLQSLSVTGFPIGCSVDPTTGNLAVASWEDSQGYNTRGGVFIFAHASGTPTFYTDPNLWQFWPPGYDAAGNLFVAGYNPTVELVELSRGGSNFQQISLGSKSITSPGGVTWDGKYVVAADLQYQGRNTTAIYRIAVSGMKGTVIGTTVLTDSCSPSKGADIMQPLIRGTTVLGGNRSCTNRVAFWSYRNGGNPTRTLPAGIAPLDAIGETISP